MNFEAIYNRSLQSKERQLESWYEKRESSSLRESVLKEARDCTAIPHERMSKVYRIFESLVDDESWKELRETIIDCENLEKKIFHAGFQYALKEDKSSLLEDYARISMFDNQIHLTESNDIEQWNNDKRRKELDKERLSRKSISLLESLNDIYLKEEVKGMLDHIMEADDTTEEGNLTPEQKNWLEKARGLTRAKIKIIDGKPVYFGTRRSNGKVGPLSKEAIESVEKKLNRELGGPFPGKETSSSTAPTDPGIPPNEKTEGIGETPKEEQNPLDAMDIETLKKANLKGISAKHRMEFSVEKIATKLEAEQKVIKDGLKSKFINDNSGMSAKKLEKKLANEENYAASETSKLLDFDAIDIRKTILQSIIEDSKAEVDIRTKAVTELASLNKRSTKFKRIKAKVLNFLKRKAPLLSKIISFAGAAFGVATKFGTMVMTFAPLGPAGPVVAVLVSAALFFIQKQIFKYAGDVTDFVIGQFFKKFIHENVGKKGPVGVICSKLASGRAEALVKTIVKILTTMIIAKPTANALTGLVQKASGPMIAGMNSIGFTAEFARKLIPDGLEGKLDKINDWALGKAPPPIAAEEPTEFRDRYPGEPEYKYQSERMAWRQSHPTAGGPEVQQAAAQAEAAQPLSVQHQEAQEILRVGVGNKMPNGYTVTEGDVNWAKTFQTDPTGKAAAQMRLRDLNAGKTIANAEGKTASNISPENMVKYAKDPETSNPAWGGTESQSEAANRVGNDIGKHYPAPDQQIQYQTQQIHPTQAQMKAAMERDAADDAYDRASIARAEAKRQHDLKRAALRLAAQQAAANNKAYHLP
jgi:hypothetical protein